MEKAFVGVNAHKLDFAWIVGQIGACANADLQHAPARRTRKTLTQPVQKELQSKLVPKPTIQYVEAGQR